MKRKVLCTIFAAVCAMGILSASAFAMTGSQDFENASKLADINGSGKFFNGSITTDETATIETETNGAYTNKYLTVKYVSGKNIMVSQPILDNDVTVVSARLKFNEGSQAGLIIRTSGNQYLAVNNGGGADLRLMNNSAYVLKNYNGKWVDVRYVITKKSATVADITGYMMLAGQPDTMISCNLNNFTINSATHLRFQTDGGVSSSIDNLVVESYNAADATVIVKEDFEQFAVGEHKPALISSKSPMQTNAENVSKIMADGTNKYLAVTNSAVLHSFLLPQKTKSVLSFDMKMSNINKGSKVFMRPTTGGAQNLVEYGDNGKVLVLGGVAYPIDNLTSEFVHFDVVVEPNNGVPALKIYVDGKKAIEKTWTSSCVFGDFRAQPASGSEIYLDNLMISTPGVASMKAATTQVTTDSATVEVTSNNIIDASTVAVTVDGAVYEADKVISDGGKTCTITLNNLDSNTNYNVAVSANDYFGQTMPTQTISIATEAVYTTAKVTAVKSIMNDEDDKATGISVSITPNDFPVNGLKWTLPDGKTFNTAYAAPLTGDNATITTLYIEDMYIEDFTTDMVSIEVISGEVANPIATFGE